MHNHGFDSKVNGNHEITTQKPNGEKFHPRWDLNHGSLQPKASVLPMSYAEPWIGNLDWIGNPPTEHQMETLGTAIKMAGYHRAMHVKIVYTNKNYHL